MTERYVESPLQSLARGADARGIEIGAVTPYYWPRRVPCVVDPFAAPLSDTDLRFSDVDLTGERCLDLNNGELLASRDYGLTVDHSRLHKRVSKNLHESKSFLITVPTGYNESDG